MIKTFCLLLTVMMLCFTNICTATNWTWVDSDVNDICNEYIDIDSIEPKNYIGEPTQASAWVKIDDRKTNKSEVMKLTFDYKNRLIYFNNGRVDNLKSGVIESVEFDKRSYPVTIAFLSKNSDFYWYAKDKITGRNDFSRHIDNRKRLKYADSYMVDDVEVCEFIDTMSIQANDNLLQFDVVVLAKKDPKKFGSVAIVQYTRDGKMIKRFKKWWIVSKKDRTLMIEQPNEISFVDVFPESLGQLEYELVMEYCKEHPEEIGKNVLE